MSDIPPLPPGYENYRLNVPAPNPLQVPGGTPEKAAEAAQQLQTKSIGQDQERNYGLWTGGQNMAAQLHNLDNAYANADAQHLNVFASGYLSQLQGKGAGKVPFIGADLAHTSRLQQIDTGIGNPELAQKEEIAADRIDALQTDLALKRQAYARVSRGGGQTEANSTGDQTQGSSGRGNIAMIRQMVGLRSESTLPGLRAKLQEGWNDVYAGMGEAIQNDPKTYTVDAAIKFFKPFGFSSDEVKQGLLNRTNPRNLPGAGGAPGANRGGPTPPAAGPHSGVDIDQEGTKPPPQQTPGLRMRPTTQAGFSPTTASTGDATNRTNMEPMETRQDLPKVPNGLPAWRAAQWDRAVQILFQHPESVGDFNKRYDPLNSTLGQRILKQYRPRGFDQ